MSKNEIKKNLKKLLKADEITQFQYELILEKKCSQCGEQLLNLIDNGVGEKVIKCEACGEEYELEDLISDYINKNYSLTSRDIRHGEQEIVFECPECGKKTYIRDNEMNVCLSCGHVAEIKHCSQCGEEIELYEMNSFSENNGLCSYCAYKLNKDD